MVGSDTIVDLDDVILEKPADEPDAFRMLSKLSGRKHLVHSGVAIYTSAAGPSKPVSCWYDTTSVEMMPLTDDEIWAYIKTGEPMVSTLFFTPACAVCNASAISAPRPCS